MNILYVNVIEGHSGWGAECFVDRGLRRQGHATFTIDFREHRHHLADKFQQAGPFDVFFLQRGDYFPVELVECVRTPRLFWASELVSRCSDQDHLLKSGLFDHVFVHSKACEREVVRRGWLEEGRVSVLLNGFDEEAHRRLDGVPRDIDVLFLGSILPRRRALLDRLQEVVPVHECQAYGMEMTRMFNRAKIVLNLHAEDRLDTETRIFEALGCGSFVLTERLSEDSPFVSGKHLVEAADFQDLVGKLNHYLRHETERDLIASQGHQEAVLKHTYGRRAEHIAGIMARCLSENSSGDRSLNLAGLRKFKKNAGSLALKYLALKKFHQLLRKLN